MSGSDSSRLLNADDVRNWLKEQDGGLEDFERKSGLPAFVDGADQSESQRLLSLPPNVLHKMTAVECGEGAYGLRQFSLHLQRMANRFSTRQKMLQRALQFKKGDQKYSDSGFAELRRLQDQTELRKERLSYLIVRVDAVAASLESLQFSKRKRGEND